ncbi:MAG: SDR family oxidoreductase [Alphaproteobacteria bacterium]|nr:SDR family oxidoreductase [Alphaproteobacteria bacterium]
MLRLEDKVIVIAGGGTGIGAGTALRLASEGARVVIGDLSAERARAVVGGVRERGGRATALGFDVTDEPTVGALMRAAVDEYGGLDGLQINVADLSIHRHDGDALELDLAVFDRVMAVGLRGHLLCTRYALPHLLARGGGAIVYTTSAAAFIGEPKRVSYAMAKSGVHALMRHVATRWGKEGIRANAIAPGMVRTEANVGAPPERFERALRGTRSRRLGLPEDIAAMTALLLSADGEWINGQMLSVDGGATIR